MKRLAAIYSLVLVVLCACGPRVGQGGALPTPKAACEGNVCVVAAHPKHDGEWLSIDFELTDGNGEVVFGSEPTLEGLIKVGLYLYEDGEDTFLGGVGLPMSRATCYVGNDIPWAEGRLPAVCGTGIDLNSLQVRPAEGDLIHLRLIEYDFEQFFRFPAPEPEPTSNAVVIPDLFREQLVKLLDEGARLNAMTESGVSYIEYGKQVPAVNAAYDLAAAMWPDGFADGARKEMEEALVGWDLTRYLWGLKIDDKDNPVEPRVNGFDRFLAYDDRGLLVISTHPSNYIVEGYRGKQYLPFDENIGILFALAGNHFEEAQATIIEALETE